MREIYVVNPKAKKSKRRAKRKRPATGGTSMPKKRRSARKRTKNPTKKTAAIARRASRAIGASFMGLNFKKALADLPWFQAGMFSAKWAAKRLGETNPATETDPEGWNWSSYVKGALGGVVGALLLSKIKHGAGQKVLEGALNYVTFKALQNELIAKSEWATAQFGAEDEYMPNEYLVSGTEEEPYAYDQNGQIMPADDRHRIPEMSGPLEPVGPLGRFGSALEPIGPLGQADAWSKAFIE